MRFNKMILDIKVCFILKFNLHHKYNVVKMYLDSGYQNAAEAIYFKMYREEYIQLLKRLPEQQRDLMFNAMKKVLATKDDLVLKCPASN